MTIDWTKHESFWRRAKWRWMLRRGRLWDPNEPMITIPQDGLYRIVADGDRCVVVLRKGEQV